MLILKQNFTCDLFCTHHTLQGGARWEIHCCYYSKRCQINFTM